MSSFEKQAVVSVYDKSNLSHLMRSLVGLEWEIFATEGSARVYRDDTGLDVSRFSDLVAASGEAVSPDREQVAKAVSRIIFQKRTVQLVCVNLKPPQEIETMPGKYTFDIGGVAMISAANVAKALVLTQPAHYDAAIAQLRLPGGVEPEFRQAMEAVSRQHVNYYYQETRDLTGE